MSNTDELKAKRRARRACILAGMAMDAAVEALREMGAKENADQLRGAADKVWEWTNAIRDEIADEMEGGGK